MLIPMGASTMGGERQNKSIVFCNCWTSSWKMTPLLLPASLLHGCLVSYKRAMAARQPNT